jgi:hypothetical protein
MHQSRFKSSSVYQTGAVATTLRCLNLPVAAGKELRKSTVDRQELEDIQFLPDALQELEAMSSRQ